MTAIDAAFERARTGDHDGFADWVRLVEVRLRGTLRRFARGADVEAVLQESLLRMWRLAPGLHLQGDDASLRYATTIAANLAKAEIRRGGRFDPIEDRDDPPVEGAPLGDPWLRSLILSCFARLSGRPREALLLRLTTHGTTHDRDLAGTLGMTLNTFLQNVVRARTAIAKCLSGHGVEFKGLVP